MNPGPGLGIVAHDTRTAPHALAQSSPRGRPRQLLQGCIQFAQARDLDIEVSH
jgi:hypothetical protein